MDIYRIVIVLYLDVRGLGLLQSGSYRLTADR